MTCNPERVVANLQRVRDRIAESAAASGRPASAITLVAVTKYVDVDLMRPLIDAGCVELGESRPQQLWTKAERLDGAVRWHLVGHLQRNKVDRTAPLTHLIHSIDSQRLLRALNTWAERAGKKSAILLEVNISGDEAKHGWAPQEMRAAVESLVDLPHVEVRGLMAMASMTGGRDSAQRDFAALRELRDHLLPNCPAGTSLSQLSMGMSADFDLAIREGATIVRVGSTLFDDS